MIKGFKTVLGTISASSCVCDIKTARGCSETRSTTPVNLINVATQFLIGQVRASRLIQESDTESLGQMHGS